MSIQIFIKNGLNGKTTIYDVDEKDYIINLKQQIHEQEHILPVNQRLIYAGKQLLSNKKICYFIGTQHKAFLNIRFNKGSFVLDPFRYIKKRDGVKIVEIGEGAKIQKI